MVTQVSAPMSERTPTRDPVPTSFELIIDGKKYQVQVLRPGVIAVDGNLFNVEMTPNGVKVDGESFVASMCTDFGIVSGKLYETECKIQ
jgi:hypothetical protein